MTLEWEIHASGRAAVASTLFVKMRVSWCGDDCFAARVETVKGAGLKTTDRLPSLDEARAWCKQEYAALLQSELDRLGA